MKNSKSKLSRILDLIIPIAIVMLLIILGFLADHNMKENRNLDATQFMGLMEVVIKTDYDRDGMLSKTSFAVTKYLNDLPDRRTIVYIYDEKINRIIPLTPEEEPNDFYNIHDRLGQLIQTEESGHIWSVIDGIGEDIYFRWMEIEEHGSRYLVVYAINENIFNIEMIRLLIHLITFLVFGYALKVSFFDRMMYIKLLQKEQKRIMSKFEYNRYNDSNNKEG